MLRHDMEIVLSRGRVFLMELGQLMASSSVGGRMAEDISGFLGMERPLMLLGGNGGVDGDGKRSYHVAEKRTNFIDICEDDHVEVRAALVEIGKEASTWIHEYFLESPDVMVSSKQSFL